MRTLLLALLMAGCAGDKFMDSTRAADGSFLRYKESKTMKDGHGNPVLEPHEVRTLWDEGDTRFVLVAVGLAYTSAYLWSVTQTQTGYR